MLSVFVDKKKSIEIDAYAFEENDGLRVVTDAKEVPAGKEPETLKFSFRRPNHNDSTYLTSSTLTLDEGGIREFDIIKLQDLSFRRLIEKWNLTDQDGKKVPITPGNIDNLDPEVVRSVSGELVGIIRL